jgi:energy-coupling factor transporter ATP-binding protein EcfA2
MAGRVNHAEPPRRDVGSEYNAWSNITVSLGVVILLTIIAMPAALVGMVLWTLLVKLTRPTWLTIATFAVISAVVVVGLGVLGEIPWLWPLGMLVPDRLYHLLPVVSAEQLTPEIWRGLAIELWAGPMLLVALEGFYAARNKTLTSGLFQQARAGEETGFVASIDGMLHRYASVVSPVKTDLLADKNHPRGGIRLGADHDNRRRPFDLAASELRQHVFIPGASGSGKTTTLARLADGAMQSGYGVVIVDCKGGGLGAVAKMLASRHNVPYIVVDPDDPATLGYNPCTGDGPDVTNKLIGAFSYGTEGEIYKQVAMRVLPVIVKGLVAAKRPVTLATITDACDQNALAQLGYDAGPPVQEELARIAQAEGIGKAGYQSLEYRFGALLQGKFGTLFTKEPALDWDAVLAKQSVVYVCLSATAASEDVELMGRVIAQDLKQVCARRLRLVGTGHAVTPVIVAFDEFAALREAEQITDLLLQARQAEMPVLLSTQYLPEAVPIRKAALQAGVLVVHRLDAKDAEEIAAQFGTKSAWKVTQQMDWETGTSQKGSIRDVEEYVVHPNTLRRLPTGQAAVRSVPTDRTAIVEVIKTT